jgi:RNA polymerase sigma-70 factor (ECF subfamily)
MFTLVGDALRETNATPAQRAALYEVAARIPGVELIGHVRDPVGRPGIAVAHSGKTAGIRETLILDPETSVLLSEEQVTLDGNSFGYPAGTVIGHATYVTRGVVDSMP